MVGTNSAGKLSSPPIPAEYNTGTPSAFQDEQGRFYTYAYDSAGTGNVTGMTYYNSASVAVASQSCTYDNTKPNHPVASYTDQIGRTTNFTYDQFGNLTSKEVGTPGQPEHACYQWDYYNSTGQATLPDGTSVAQPANFVQHAYYPVNSAGTFGDYLLYVYDAQGRLAGVQEPDDAVGSTTYHWAYTYTYQTDSTKNGYGELLTVTRVTDPTQTPPTGYKSTYAYDLCNRVSSVAYDDHSTEEYLYGTAMTSAGNFAAGRLMAYKDRNGYVTDFLYDPSGRLQQKTVAKYSVATSGNPTGTIFTLAGTYPPSGAATPPEASATTYSYLDGTDLPSRVIANSDTNTTPNVTTGQTTRYTYDYRHRVVGQTAYPIFGTPLWTERRYINNQLFYAREPYGTRTYNNYRDFDGRLLMSVKETLVPGTPTFSSFSDFSSFNAAGNYGLINGGLLVTSYTTDSAGQVTSTTDPRGILHTTAYDSRGRATDQYDDTATLNAHTATLYNLDNTVQQVESPRYFAGTGDTNGNGKSYETFLYTRRTLRASHTVDPAGTVPATEYWNYNTDRTLNTHVDFNGAFLDRHCAHVGHYLEQLLRGPAHATGRAAGCPRQHG